MNSNGILDLVNNSTTTFNKRLARITALYIKWNYKNIEEMVLKRDVL